MMNETPYGRIVADGFWNNNQALVALLGLCPLLAVTSTAVNGLGLGLATTLTLLLTNVIVAVLRPWLRKEVRIPVFVLVIASVVTTVHLLMNAHLYGLYRVLGIFVPLIVTNCAIVARAEVFASRNPIGASVVDGIGMGAGFATLLIAIGAFRELVGQASILSRLDMLTGGEPFAGLSFADRGLILAILPPGAFFSLALAVAAKNAIDRKRRPMNRTGVWRRSQLTGNARK